MTQIVPQELLDRIRAKRAYQNKSQEQVADIIGRARPTYRLKENGNKEFKLSEFANTVIALGFTIEEIGEMIMLFKTQDNLQNE